MSYSVKEIAAALGAQAFGAVDLLIDAVSEPADAGPRDLALATNPKYAEALAKGDAKCAMLWDGADWEALGLEAAIVPNRPRFAMSGLTQMMDAGQGFGAGIHPSAVIDPTATIGEGVSIGPLTVISAGACIGAGCHYWAAVLCRQGRMFGCECLYARTGQHRCARNNRRWVCRPTRCTCGRGRLQLCHPRSVQALNPCVKPWGHKTTPKGSHSRGSILWARCASAMTSNWAQTPPSTMAPCVTL